MRSTVKIVGEPERRIRSSSPSSTQCLRRCLAAMPPRDARDLTPNRACGGESWYDSSGIRRPSVELSDRRPHAARGSEGPRIQSQPVVFRRTPRMDIPERLGTLQAAQELFDRRPRSTPLPRSGVAARPAGTVARALVAIWSGCDYSDICRSSVSQIGKVSAFNRCGRKRPGLLR